MAADCILESAGIDKNQSIIVSSGERAAQEIMNKIVSLAKAMHRAFPNLPNLEIVSSNKEYCEFANGSWVRSLPNSPMAIRSWTGNVYWDEAAFQEEEEEIWKAILPIVSSEARGRKWRLTITSSANGVNNRFYKLFAEDPNFSKHLTDCYKALKEGHKMDLEVIRTSMSADQFDQEYGCKFIDSSASLYVFTHDALKRSMNPDFAHQAGDTAAYIDFAAGRDENVIAYKCGNKVHDLIHWVERDTMKTASRCLVELQRLKSAYGLDPKDTWCDATGLGKPIADKLKEMGWPINEDHWGGSVKRDSRIGNKPTLYWFKARDALDQGSIILPDDPLLFNQLAGRKYEISGGSGKAVLESKSKLGRSPDRADAVCGLLFRHPTNFFTSRELTKFDEIFNRPDEDDGEWSIFGEKELLAGANAGW